MLKGLTQEDNHCLYALSGHMDIIKEDPSVSQTESCPCITRTAIHLYSWHVILQHFPCNSCSRGNAWLAVAFSRGLHTGRGCFWWGNLWRGIPISLLPHLRPARSTRLSTLISMGVPNTAERVESWLSVDMNGSYIILQVLLLPNQT